MTVNNQYGPVKTWYNRFNEANSALYFTGTGYIELPSSPLIQPSNELTFSGWVWFSYLNPTNEILFTQNNLAGPNKQAYGLSVITTSNGVAFAASKAGPAGLNQAIGTTQVSNLTWYHVAFTMDNNFIKLYVNGSLEATTPVTFSGYDYNFTDVYLASSNTGTQSAPMTGGMDNVRFYDRVLSPSEINLLFTTDPSCYTTPPPSPDCNDAYYTITTGAIYKFKAGYNVTPTVVPAVLPDSAIGLGIAPSFSFNAPNPTYWTISKGKLWYFDGIQFVNSNDSAGYGVTDLGGSKNFLYGWNHLDGKVYRYTGAGNAAYLTTINSYSNASSYDLVGDDMDNFYIFNTQGNGAMAIHNPSGAFTYSWTVFSYPGGVLTAGMAIMQNTFAPMDYQTIYLGKPGIATVITFSQTLTQQKLVNDMANCYVRYTSSITPSPNGTVSCANPIITLTCISGMDGFLINHVWSGPGIVSSGSNIAIVNLPGIYGCTVTNVVSGSTTSANYSVSYANTPFPINVSTTDSILCIGNTATLTGSGANSYTWSNMMNTNSIVVSPTITSTYTLTGTGTGTCVSSTAFTQSVVSCLSIRESAGTNSKLIIFPNPSGSFISIKLSGDINTPRIRLLDLPGRIIREENIPQNANFDLSGLVPGPYFLEIYDGPFLLSVKKIMKE